MYPLHFGYCDSMITPPQTIGLAGYEYRNQHGFGNSGVIDPIYARALSIRCKGEHLVIITLDICTISEELADCIRERVSDKLQIPIENIMLSLSHTHSGPTLRKNSLNSNDDNTRIDAYFAGLTDKILTLCSQASTIDYIGRMYTATFSTYMGYNRRYTLDDGGTKAVKMLFSLWRNPGQDFNGIVDPNIPILEIERVDEKQYDPYLAQSGTDRIILFSVPIHPVVLGEENRYVSADYPGAARKCIEDTLGDGTKAMFFLGACGNVNPLMACQNNPRAVDIIGNALGLGICAALSNRKEVIIEDIRSIYEPIKIKNTTGEKRIITQLFKLGQAAIAAVSCECFTELGLYIREKSDCVQTLVATNSNGGEGYIPTRDILENGSGGYEVESAIRSGFDENLLERMAATVVKNLKNISAAKA